MSQTGLYSEILILANPQSLCPFLDPCLPKIHIIFCLNLASDSQFSKLLITLPAFFQLSFSLHTVCWHCISRLNNFLLLSICISEWVQCFIKHNLTHLGYAVMQARQIWRITLCDQNLLKKEYQRTSISVKIQEMVCHGRSIQYLNKQSHRSTFINFKYFSIFSSYQDVPMSQADGSDGGVVF